MSDVPKGIEGRISRIEPMSCLQMTVSTKEGWRQFIVIPESGTVYELQGVNLIPENNSED